MVVSKHKRISLLSLLALMILFFSGCQAEKEGQKVQEVPTNGKISSIIRNPVTSDGPIDTVNVAKMIFNNAVFDFGEIREGATVEHEFQFTNYGKVPLVIHNAHSTCGCTVPDWPKVPISPGQGGTIKVMFDSENRTGFQEKPITITSNTYPSTTRIYIRGNVL